MGASSVVIPAYPYEGPLLWLIAPTYHLFATPEQLSADEYTGGSSYYEALYGPHAGLLKHRAASLSMIFDRLEFAPIDVSLPDSHTHTTGGDYHHPDLKLAMSWNWPDWPTPQQDSEMLERAVLTDPTIRQILASDDYLPTDPATRLSLLYRILIQMRVAVARGGVLLGNTVFQKLFGRMSEIIAAHASMVSDRVPAAWSLDTTFVDLVGLDLNVGDLETFAALRSSDTVRRYARDFQAALELAQQGSNPRERLLQLMREARDKHHLARHIQGAFETTGSIANVASLIPVLGTATTAFGLATDAGARLAEASAQKRQWYLLGAKMREVALDVVLGKDSK